MEGLGRALSCVRTRLVACERSCLPLCACPLVLLQCYCVCLPRNPVLPPLCHVVQPLPRGARAGCTSRCLKRQLRAPRWSSTSTAHRAGRSSACSGVVWVGELCFASGKRVAAPCAWHCTQLTPAAVHITGSAPASRPISTLAPHRASPQARQPAAAAPQVQLLGDGSAGGRPCGHEPRGGHQPRRG